MVTKSGSIIRLMAVGEKSSLHSKSPQSNTNLCPIRRNSPTLSVRSSPSYYTSGKLVVVAANTRPFSGCAATTFSQSNKVPTGRLSQARMVLPYSRELADAVLNGVTPLNEALEHSFQPCVGSRTRPLPNGLKNTLGKRKSSVLQLKTPV